MKPIFKIEANDQNVTGVIHDRFISGLVTDNEGLKSDRFEVTLDDRDNRVVIPAEGAELNVWLGYEETGLTYMGLYIYDETDLGGPVNRVTLKCKAAHVGNSKTLKGKRGSLKQHKTRGWHEKTLDEIVATVAEEAGYEPRVFPDLGKEFFPHLDQTEESDLNLLTRLAKHRNAVAKPAGGAFVFVPRGRSKSATGRTIVDVPLGKGDLTDWHMNIAEREAYLSVEAVWHNLEAAERITVTAGEGEPIKKVRGTFATADEAGLAAESELKRIQRGKSAPSFTLPGRPELAAECNVIISELRTEFVGAWSVKTATHNFSKTGYTTTIECEVPEK